MSKRNQHLFLFDIFIAILKIEKVSLNYTSADKLKHDFMAWDSVIREFEIIGEATKHLIDANILDTEYRTIVDFRNILIHAYFGIDEEEVWHIIQNNLEHFKQLTQKTIISLNKETKESFISNMIEENIHHDFIVNTLKDLRG